MTNENPWDQLNSLERLLAEVEAKNDVSDALARMRDAAAHTGRPNAIFDVTLTSTLPELRQQFPQGEYWEALLKGLSPERIYAALVRIEELVAEGLPFGAAMKSVMRGIARVARFEA